MPVVSVSMPEELIDRLDAFADEHDYTGRSEVLREGSRTLLSEFQNERLEDRPLAGIVSVLYEFGTQNVEQRVTRLRHEHEASIVSNTHTHVADYCMELFVLEGELEEMSAFVGSIRSIEAIETVDYSLVPLDSIGQLPEQELY